jgi:DinB family protein
MQGTGQQLRQVVDRTSPVLAKMSDELARERTSPDGWSKKQILGHLIDSASNNHQRFVRAQLQDELVWPSYDQPGCVRVQKYQECPWSDLVQFWSAYNRFLAHVLESMPASKAGTICRIGDDAPMTLEELAQDYVRHLEHHLDQIIG